MNRLDLIEYIVVLVLFIVSYLENNYLEIYKNN
jgi:hypothetical protein